jgi:hypothetical protein
VGVVGVVIVLALERAFVVGGEVVADQDSVFRLFGLIAKGGYLSNSKEPPDAAVVASGNPKAEIHNIPASSVIHLLLLGNYVE